MEKFTFVNTKEIKNEKSFLEERLKVSITIDRKNVTLEGPAYEEYLASHVLEAMSLGFSARKALLLLDEEIIFKRINIKGSTRRKNLKEVRSRIIGTQGRTKRTIETIANCNIIIHENEIGLIGPIETVEAAETAIKNIIKGTKQANAYRYLEKMNRSRDIGDLGLKNKTHNNI